MNDSLQIGVIGMGHVGPAIASALRAGGHRIVAVSAHSAAASERAAVMLPGVPQVDPMEVVAGASLVFLAVPDSQIGAVALELGSAWRPGQVVVHLSGATGLGALQPAAAAGAMTLSMHPAMTFTGTSLDVSRLEGCPVAVTAPPLVMPLAELLAREIGGIPFPLAEENKTRYHAALAHASNHLVTLVSQARELLLEVGIDRPGEFLRPLTTAALDGALERGMGALTGPVQRGDREVVQAHLDELGDTTVGETYRALSEATRIELASYRRRSTEEEHS